MAQDNKGSIGAGIKFGIGGCVGVVICMGACAACFVVNMERGRQNVSTPSSSIPSQSTPSQPTGVTLSQFNQLRDGMTYDQAVKILGTGGTEMSSNNIAGIKTVMYQWKGCCTVMANMNAMFQNGKLISKAQFGLQ